MKLDAEVLYFFKKDIYTKLFFANKIYTVKSWLIKNTTIIINSFIC